MCLDIQDFWKYYYLTSTLFLPLWSSCDCQLRPSSGDFVWWLCRLLLVSTMPELGSPSWTLSGCGWIWPHLHSYTGTWSLTQSYWYEYTQVWLTHTKKEKIMLISLFLPRSSIAVLKLPPLFILTSTRRANLHMDTVNYSAWIRKLFLVTKHLINTSLQWTLFNPKAPPRSSVCSEVNS